MISVVSQPFWFLLSTSVIDLVSAGLLAILAFSAFKYFNINKKSSKWLQLAISFAAIATAYFGLAVLHYVLAARHLGPTAGGIWAFGFSLTDPRGIILALGIIGVRFLHLFGLWLLYSVYRKQTPKDIAFMAFILAVLVYFGQATYFVYHLVALVLVLMLASEYLLIYRARKNRATLFLMGCFLILTISQLLFILAALSPVLATLGSISEFVGFALLLVSFLTIMRHGKKIQN